MTEKNPDTDPFILDYFYKEPLKSFFFQLKPLEEIKKECLVFLDTSTLMAPYDIGVGSLNSLNKVYKQLALENRLFIPRRVMQEYENLAPTRLTEMYHRIANSLKDATINFAPPVRMLGELDEYKKANDASQRALHALDEYKSNIQKVLAKIEGWRHNDVVRSSYHEIFNDTQFVSEYESNEDIEKQRKKLLSDWNFRLANRVPPGYLDRSKKDTGIGDFLVWMAILKQGKKSGKDAIFVTQDISEDILHGTLFARREMVEEYRATTDGMTIHFVKPDKFAELFGTPETVVRELHQFKWKSRWEAAREIPDLSTVGRWANQTYGHKALSASSKEGYYEIMLEMETTNSIVYLDFPENLSSIKANYEFYMQLHNHRMKTNFAGVQSTIVFVVAPEEILSAKSLVQQRITPILNLATSVISQDEFTGI